MSAPVTRCPGCWRPLPADARDHRTDPTCGWRAEDDETPDETEDADDE